METKSPVKFKRATLTLEMHNRKNGTYYEVPSVGYSFEAWTKDGSAVTLYVYKDPEDAYGGWLVNDYESNATIGKFHCKTRKDAAKNAFKTFENRTYAEVEEVREGVEYMRQKAQKNPVRKGATATYRGQQGRIGSVVVFRRSKIRR